MAGPSFDLDPVETLAVATEGEPGSRRFFLLATSAGSNVTLACEKFHIQGLITRIGELLSSHGLEGEAAAAATADAGPDLKAAWTIGELGLGYHESRQLFVLVAREASGEGEGGSDEPATARFWATPPQVRAFAQQAERVLAAGRPPCPYCGLPVDPGGHPCPASNGARPIL
jgi:uncharacterized repeat protein (TIGR03847 family)